MEKLKARLRLSLGTKVLVPVVASMVLLLVVTVLVVNWRITRQFQMEAARNLALADTALVHSRNIRTHDLIERYHNLPKEPRYRAAFQSGDRPTVGKWLEEDVLKEHQAVEVILFQDTTGEKPVLKRRDSFTSAEDFESACGPAATQAMKGDEVVDTIRVGEKLFDIVALPALGSSDTPIGALVLGLEIGNSAAQDLRDFTQCQVVLLANGRVIASSLARPDLNEALIALFQQGLTTGRSTGPRKAELADEHYFCSAGAFTSLSQEGELGYLLLSSYEQPLRALQSTQRILMALSAAGILIGTLIVWLLVLRVTQPLRDLRDSVEAVGRGDYSQKVEVKSADECGELAWVFNQMTENIRRSREQLVQMVDTLKTTQAQLVQSEKLSGIGEFVAGVAHELNNPLTSVMGFSELLARADTNPKHKRHLDLIFKSAQRCQKIVQNLLSFARRHQPERKLSNINELIETAIDFLQYQLRTSNVEVATRLDPGLPGAMVDPHQLQQVFLNIINNGRQAIEAHQPRGSIRVTTETCGDKARITIQDDGPGISEQNLSKVFDPFFTTKEVGKGTGLGLSLCYGTVKEHGGTIEVRSRPGEGATFVIEVPLGRGDSPAEGLAIAPAEECPSQERPGVGKKVLVIDDEEAILQMVSETLASEGYEVDVARDGESALSRLDKATYDLALCDWKMPGLNGQQVYERLRATDPALSERMIFITGDVINEKAVRFLSDTHKVCLAKPFSLAEFRAAVVKALAPS